MRCRTPWILLILSLATWLAPRAARAQAPCELPWEDEDLIVEGRVGTREIRARLGRGSDDDPDDARAVSGDFNYGTRWRGPSEFKVYGVLDQGCSIRMNERDATRRNTGTWVLRFAAADRLEGTRTDAATGITAPIVLWEAPMVDCSGSGPWRTFRSDSWPITFSYPANWQLTEDADGVVLLCPTPDRLVYGGRPMILERGAGLRTVVEDNGRTGTYAGQFFVRFSPEPWLVGDYYCADPPPTGCPQALTGRRFGLTVLQGLGREDRLYTRHGYVGQGAGSIVYLFLRDSQWVTLLSHDLPEWGDRAFLPGPARFDGSGVTERIVRSVRPRTSK